MNLIKRNPENPNCPWTVRFSCRNRIYNWSTKTPDKALAARRAKDYRDKVISGAFHLVDSMKANSGIATFTELEAAYMALPRPALNTRRGNVHALHAVMAASGLTGGDRVDRITPQVIIRYQQSVLNARPNDPSARVSVNSRVRLAKSLFSRKCLLAYKGSLNIPRETILEAFSVEKMDEDKPAKELPSDAAIAAAIEALKDKPEHYRAFLLARYAGCRAGEVRAARREWLSGNVLTIGDRNFMPKSGKARRVAIPQEVAELLLHSDDPVYLVGPRRHEVVNRELPALLIKAGFPRKPIQSLRRLFGSILFSTQSPGIAQQSLGHSSIVTTQRHYASELSKMAPIAFAG